MSRFTFVAVVALAGTKVIVGLLSSVVALSDSALGAGLPIWGGNFWSTLAIVLAFSITAVVLLAGQSTGLQTRWLGLFMLLAATPFAAALGRMGHPLGGLPDLLSRLHLEAALPATLWLFVSVFPRHSSHKDKPAPKAGVDGWVIGPIAFASLTLDVLTVEGLVATYWPLLMLAMLPAGPLLARRARLASPGERRRVVWFAAAIAAGLSPMAIDIVLRAASSSWRSVVADPGNNRLVTTIAIVCFLSVPATTAYLVVARRVFEFRLVLRKAIGYALAKTTLLLLIVVPTALLARLLFVNRTSTIEELITGPRAIACLVTAAVAAVAFATRVSLVQAIDRRLDRRERDSHDTLFGLVEACRDALSLDDLARMVVGAIEKSLQPTRVAFNVLDESQQQYVDPHASAPALPARSLLVPLLSASNTPLSLAGGVDPSLRGRLDPQSSEWLDTSAWRLLVPMRDDTGALRGMLALGEKRDEHEYTTADRKLLGLVGMACGMALRTRQSAPKTPAPAAVGLPTPSNELAPARECEQCGLVGTPTGIFCSCGGLLHEADVPLVLAGKYKVAMRIGRGGMGVVYRATDLALAREVAIKTLPHSDSVKMARLRREAQTMAQVSHTCLAAIYGLETWNDRPVLVVEFMANGTLADRISKGPVPLAESVRVLNDVGRGVAALHDARLLHRDIKPSNVGFAANGAAKLLDFGLAKSVMTDPEAAGDDQPPLFKTTSGLIVGTPSHLPPEAFDSVEPSEAFDLWALGVLLVESLLGRNPFQARSFEETYARIRSESFDPLKYLVNPSPALRDLLELSLSRNPHLRIPTAHEFLERLAAVH